MLHYYFDTAGYFQEALTLHLAAVRCAVEESVRGRSYNSLGGIYWRLGRYADGRACYLRALELASAVGDRPGEGRGLSNVALSHFRLGEYTDAIDYHRRALAIFEELDIPSRVSITLAGLGWDELRLGRTEIALRHFRRSLEAARSIGDATCEEAYALANVGAAYELSGAVAEARQHYEQALELSSRLDFPMGQIDALNSMGRLHLAAGRVNRALTCHGEALDIGVRQGTRPMTIEIRNDYGHALLRAGRLEEALDQHTAALADAEELQEPFELGRAYEGAANVLAAQGQVPTDLRSRALTLFTSLKVPEAARVSAQLAADLHAPEPPRLAARS
jgi:tetratricopeptide (TPR) repeat protein